MKLSIVYLILFSFCLINFNCNNIKNESNNYKNKTSPIQENYEYADELILFHKNELNENISDLKNGILFYVPLNSCFPCVKETIEGLNETISKERINEIVITGQTKDTILNKSISLLKNNYESKIKFDTSSKLFRYELNIGGPTIIIVEESRFYQISLNDQIWKNKNKYLSFLKY